MHLPRILLCVTIFSLLLSNGNAQKQQEESADRVETSNNNLRGAATTTTTTTIWRRFLQFGFGDTVQFAFSTRCETDCIAANSNSCYGVPTPTFCVERHDDPDDAIGVRSECYMAGFVFLPDLDTPRGGSYNLGSYEKMDLEEIADKCYAWPGNGCKGFSTTHYLKNNIPPTRDLVEYTPAGGDDGSSDDDVICRGLYLKQ